MHVALALDQATKSQGRFEVVGCRAYANAYRITAGLR